MIVSYVKVDTNGNVSFTDDIVLVQKSFGMEHPLELLERAIKNDGATFCYTDLERQLTPLVQEDCMEMPEQFDNPREESDWFELQANTNWSIWECAKMEMAYQASNGAKIVVWREQLDIHAIAIM